MFHISAFIPIHIMCHHNRGAIIPDRCGTIEHSNTYTNTNTSHSHSHIMFRLKSCQTTMKRQPHQMHATRKAMASNGISFMIYYFIPVKKEYFVFFSFSVITVFNSFPFCCNRSQAAWLNLMLELLPQEEKQTNIRKTWHKWWKNTEFRLIHNIYVRFYLNENNPSTF